MLKISFCSTPIQAEISDYNNMDSLQVIRNDVDKQLERLISFYNHHVLPYLKRTSQNTYIAAAVAAFISYQVYKMVQVPKNLRHIPAVSYWKYMKSALSGEGIDVRAQNVILPVLAKSPNGIYLRPNRLGWTIGVANPVAMKTLFLRTSKSFFPLLFTMTDFH